MKNVILYPFQPYYIQAKAALTISSQSVFLRHILVKLSRKSIITISYQIIYYRENKLSFISFYFADWYHRYSWFCCQIFLTAARGVDTIWPREGERGRRGLGGEAVVLKFIFPELWLEDNYLAICYHRNVKSYFHANINLIHWDWGKFIKYFFGWIK